jgi:chaperonin GroES
MARAGKKDVLAAGGAKMVIAGGVGDNDIFRNVSKEPRFEDVPQIEKPKVKRQKFVPRDEQMLIRSKPAEVLTSVIITEGTVEPERPAEGFVLERGPKVDIPVGAHVVYGKYAGTEFKLNGETLLIMRLEDIMGTVEDTEDDYLVPAGRA